MRKVVDELERRLAKALQQAVRARSSRATRTRRPRLPEIDWDRTMRANLRTTTASAAPSSPRSSSATAAAGRRCATSILCVDQSGSMATSVVYSSIFGAVLASIRAVSTRLVVFDTRSST